MPADDLPPGVTLESGMLVDNFQLASVLGVDTPLIRRFNLGPGEFVVGLHGVNYRWNLAATTTEATVLFSLVPSDLTGAGSVGAQVFGWRQENTIQATGIVSSYNIMLPKPAFTASDIVCIVSTAIAVGIVEVELYYAIYKVTSTVFTRIAGIVLARG